MLVNGIGVREDIRIERQLSQSENRNCAELGGIMEYSDRMVIRW